MPFSVRSATAGVPRPVRSVLLVYVVLGVGLWMVPLLNLLHAESSAVVALVAFFAAGLSSLVLFAEERGLGEVLAWQEAALVVPWLLLTVTLPWAPNCGYSQGVQFYLLFPVVSVVPAVAGAYFLSTTPWRRKRSIFLGAGLAVAILAPLYDLGLHPQFYVYNHVFGGVLGPIYDEELVIWPGLLVFRGLTLLWAGVFIAAARWRQSGDGTRGAPYGLAVLGIGILIGLAYLFAAPLGINTTERYLREALGGHLQTEHFDLYYDPTALSDDDLYVIAEDHEYRYAGLAGRLHVEIDDRIASYLYPDPAAKARLTGARFTNVAPVWLRRPQVHVLLDAYDRVFAHELAHVFSRSFGLPVLRASQAVGLVEGLAVALEPPDGLPTPHEQVSVALATRFEPGGGRLAETVAARLTPWGFWTGRGAVSYTTMGSFVRYLLDAYGPEPFKQAYARADFESAYGKPVEVLAAEWLAFIASLPAVDRAAGAFAQRRFRVPSLFEKRCPHYVPPFLRRYRKGEDALAEEDTARALKHLEASLAGQPAFAPALAAWAGIRLAEGAAADVVARLDTLDAAHRTPALAVRLGDAYAVLGRPDTARVRYETALRRLPIYAHEQAVQVVLRKSLAEDPAALRILTSGATPGQQAARLDALTGASPSVAVLAALRWAAAGRYARALERLQQTPAPEEARWTAAQRAAVHRQRLAWLARLAYRAGRPDAASVYARQAARAFRGAGAFNDAALWQDFVVRMGWVQQPGNGLARGDAS